MSPWLTASHGTNRRCTESTDSWLPWRRVSLSFRQRRLEIEPPPFLVHGVVHGGCVGWDSWCQTSQTTPNVNSAECVLWCGNWVTVGVVYREKKDYTRIYPERRISRTIMAEEYNLYHIMLSIFKSLTCPRQDLAISHELNAHADGWSVVYRI